LLAKFEFLFQNSYQKSCFTDTIRIYYYEESTLVPVLTCWPAITVFVQLLNTKQG